MLDDLGLDARHCDFHVAVGCVVFLSTPGGFVLGHSDVGRISLILWRLTFKLRWGGSWTGFSLGLMWLHC